MPKNDFLRRSLVLGLSFLDMTRERAEAFVKELVDEGVVRKGQAEKVVEEVVERSKKRTDALGKLVRREVGAQLSASGVATKDDIARLEALIAANAKSNAVPDTPAPKPPRAGSTKAAPITKAATRRTRPKAPGSASNG